MTPRPITVDTSADGEGVAVSITTPKVLDARIRAFRAVVEAVIEAPTLPAPMTVIS